MKMRLMFKVFIVTILFFCFISCLGDCASYVNKNNGNDPDDQTSDPTSDEPYISIISYGFDDNGNPVIVIDSSIILTEHDMNIHIDQGQRNEVAHWLDWGSNLSLTKVVKSGDYYTLTTPLRCNNMSNPYDDYMYELEITETLKGSLKDVLTGTVNTYYGGPDRTDDFAWSMYMYIYDALSMRYCITIHASCIQVDTNQFALQGWIVTAKLLEI